MTRVLITRPRTDAEPLAAELAARGISASIEPMLEIVAIPGPPLKRREAQALLFTSVNGVRALIERNAGRLDELVALPVYTVGDATARAARAAGFTKVESAAGDVAALAGLVRAKTTPGAGALLHVAGSRVAGDLSARLSAAGFTVERLMLYEARKIRIISTTTAAALKSESLDAVMFFSPRTASAFVTLCKDAGLASTLSRVAALCLSEAVAKAARIVEWGVVLVAAQPNQQALLACMAAVTEHRASGRSSARHNT